MKKFIINICAFIIVFIISAHTVYYSKIYQKLLPGTEVYECLNRSLKPNNKTKVLIAGDSVARQLFEPLNNKDFITSLACNQAIDLIGHYLLIDNFISNSDSVETVYFLYNPFSLNNDLDHKYTYNYFLKPFYSSDYIEKFTPHSISQINKIPYSLLARIPIVKIFHFCPNYAPEIDNKKALSITTIEYLNKIKNLLNLKNIRFIILSPPIAESNKNKFLSLKKSYAESEFKSKELDIYFKKVTFLPDSFYRDNVHFKNKYINEISKQVFSQFEKLQLTD